MAPVFCLPSYVNVIYSLPCILDPPTFLEECPRSSDVSMAALQPNSCKLVTSRTRRRFWRIRRITDATQAPPQHSMPTRADASQAACRYSAFIPLYPLGILGGEMPLIWSGLPYMRQRKLHSLEMPNSMNFAFSYPIFAQVRRLAVMPLVLKMSQTQGILCF